MFKRTSLAKSRPKRIGPWRFRDDIGLYVGRYLYIDWVDLRHDWHWFRLNYANKGRILLVGANAPDGTHHIGDEIIVNVTSIRRYRLMRTPKPKYKQLPISWVLPGEEI